MPQRNFYPFLRKIENFLTITDFERESILSLSFTLQNFEANMPVFHEGGMPQSCIMIVRGFSCQEAVTRSGVRRILAFQLPADMPDLQCLFLERRDFSLRTLTPSVMAQIPHAEMYRLMERCPRLGRLLWRDTMVDAAIARQWILNLSGREGRSRVAHLLCELASRLGLIGLGDHDGFEMFLTQTMIGEATGLSVVHTNRVLQSLRRDGLLETAKGRLRISDWNGLASAGGFDPAYLSIPDASRRSSPEWANA